MEIKKMIHDFSILTKRLRNLYTFSLNYEITDPLHFGEEYIKELEAYNQQEKIIELLVSRLTKSDTTHMLIIYGDPGIGKTHVVQSVMEDLHLVNKYVRSKETPTDLYINSFNYKEPGKYIILDDCDSVFDDPVQMNLLKAMGESTETRIVTYGNETYCNAIGVPSSFEYQGKVVILTNRVLQDNPDYDALLSRAKVTTMEVSNLGKVCKSIWILLTDPRYEEKPDYTKRATLIAKLLWNNREKFASDKYTLRESRKLYSDLEMLGDDLQLFSKELSKRFKDIIVNC